MSKRHSNEIVHEGWLTKSPPTQRLWRAVSRWRRRWFVLRQGDLPGQYFLEYYTDKKCFKLKGKIDLDQCEQVDAGIESPDHLRVKCRENLFDLKTPHRTYYLAADSKVEMDKWVECICRICGLKAEIDATETSYGSVQVEELSFSPMEMSFENQDVTTPTSPSSASTPYIFISECYSGKPPPGVLTKEMEAQIDNLTSDRKIRTRAEQTQFIRSQKPTKFSQSVPKVSDIPADDFYDMPRKLTVNEQDSISLGQGMQDDVFADEWTLSQAPSVNWNTFPRDSMSEINSKRASESSEASTEENPNSADLASLIVAKRFSRVITGQIDEAPPRPPKPAHFVDIPSHSYLNIESVLENKNCAPTKPSKSSPPEQVEVITDDMYDFPRSHQVLSESRGPKHCYSNASANPNGNVFQYDFNLDDHIHTSQIADCLIEPSTPKSDNGSQSSFTLYSNLPSPALLKAGDSTATQPPSVHRDLKPGRKVSDSTSCETSPSPFVPPPNVNRGLKPIRRVPDSPNSELNGFKLSAPPMHRAQSDSRSVRKQRAAPSPTPPGTMPKSPVGTFCPAYSYSDDSDEEQNFFHIVNNKFVPSNRGFDKLKYLDLDMEMGGSANGTLSSPRNKPSKSTLSLGPPTIYNTVDFVKTQAFNRTRQEVETMRQKPH
ncbi:GRB2-associated-binding protein 1 [Neocloeon triangulifer]|uniref:GRB2-associated-binding protein 1 n=1 Tax=Neocloeon triangulifer TaxID=2078957 RepID=UPI00286EFEC7|nr:GRB2-associated-binding protein 1 [Neocloeon triangulifer]